MNEHRHNEDRLRSEVGMGWWTVWFLLFMVVTFYKAAMNTEWMNCEQLPLGGNQGSSSCSLCSQHFHQWSIPNSVLCVFLSKDTLLDIYCWFLKFMLEWSSSNTPFGSSPPSCMQEMREPFGALLGSHFKQQNHQYKGQKFEKPGSKWNVKGTRSRDGKSELGFWLRWPLFHHSAGQGTIRIAPRKLDSGLQINVSE